MKFTQEQLEKLKEQLVDNFYDGMDSGDLEEFYKDAQREWINTLPDDELLDILEANGLLDNEDKEYD